MEVLRYPVVGEEVPGVEVQSFTQNLLELVRAERTRDRLQSAQVVARVEIVDPLLRGGESVRPGAVLTLTRRPNTRVTRNAPAIARWFPVSLDRRHSNAAPRRLAL